MIKKSAKPEPKTEGQKQLLEVYGSERSLSKKLGVGKAILGHWRRGIRIPSEEQKHKLELLFGIPRRAWDYEPGTDFEVPKSYLKPPEDIQKEKLENTKLSSRAKGMDTLTITTMQIEDILDALDDPTLTDGASAKLRDTLAKALALRTRLERDQELLEDRIVRNHPEWLRLKQTILTALKPYPIAAKAVLEAIISSGRP